MRPETTRILKRAVTKSIPVFFSYIFLGISYGVMMVDAGFTWYHTLFVSFTLYTGAFQFVLITFLSSGASLLTVAVTALLLNSRQSFYSLSMLEDFKPYRGFKKYYMIFTMTDETYAVDITMRGDGEERHAVMFVMAILCKSYWMLGSVLGAVIGQLIPFDTEGIDFCMTALFLIIIVDQWEKATSHRPAIVGLAVGIVALLIFGKSNFMLPALLTTSAILVLMKDPAPAEDSAPAKQGGDL